MIDLNELSTAVRTGSCVVIGHCHAGCPVYPQKRMLSVGIYVCKRTSAQRGVSWPNDLSLRPLQGKRHEARLIAGLNLHQDLDRVLVLVGIGTVHRLLDASGHI